MKAGSDAGLFLCYDERQDRIHDDVDWGYVYLMIIPAVVGHRIKFMDRKRLVILGALLFTVFVAAAQQARICPWDGDRKAAVVITFDDWTPGQYPVAVPELNQRGLVATFFVMKSSIAGGPHGWPALVATAARGHEIANHTLSHPDLTKVSPAQLGAEVRGMKAEADAALPAQQMITLAYPFGAFSQAVADSVRRSGHIAARSVFPASNNYTYAFARTDDDYYRILTFGMDGTITRRALEQQVNQVVQGGGLLTIMYHSVDDAAGTHHDNWYALVPQDSLRGQLDMLAARQDQVWITTFARAIQYHREANSAVLREQQPFDGKRWVLTLTDTLNDAIYKQPLCIRVETGKRKFTTIRQRGVSLPFEQPAPGVVLFRAVPDAGPIELRSRRK